MRLRLFRLFHLLVIASLASAVQASPHEDKIATQVAGARAILDPWHADKPEPGDRKLQLVYWTPSDREPSADYQPRLTRMMEHIRDFYADEMERLGFGPRTFNLDYQANGDLRIHLVKGAGPYADYEKKSGNKIRKECLPILKAAGIDADRETILIFCNLSEWDEEKLVFTHKSPYYAGGSHRQGTAWQLDSPELDTLNLPKTKPMMRDGEYGRISLGKHNSIFIGGIAHELGHALSLPHNKEHPAEAASFGTALMGSGNRTYGDEIRNEGKGSFLTLAHALRLASHPQFSGSVKGMNRRIEADFSELSVKPDGKSFHFSGKVSGDIPVYAVVAYCDPVGGGDYNATTATAIPDKDGNFSLHCDGLAPGKDAELRLVACHVNGATASRNQPNGRSSYPYSVDKNGTPDLSAIQRRFALAPLVEALQSKNAGRVQAAEQNIGQTGDQQTIKIAKALVQSFNTDRSKLPTPSAIKDTPSIPLSATIASTVKVGWRRPAYDHVPGDFLLLECGNQLFTTGIYAHAPATHRYDLGGNWKTLTGHCGLANGHRGSVIFIIKADGKELWRSKLTTSGTSHRYEIDLDGVKSLELQTDSGPDGTGADWGFWFDPTLNR
ncbi:NPCBM/NEW2 domain-containing protein [Haloferula sp.]|uniref:NPCBM/NEW2 domain-containing protein n=1 Tax=Haloferula sp. TaxID=2497595 RepID=UPI00329DA26F